MDEWVENGLAALSLGAYATQEEMEQIFHSYQNTVSGERARIEGHAAKFMGDGVLACFGWPVAHEDKPERSVSAGLAIITSVARLSAGSKSLSFRVGIATGLLLAILPIIFTLLASHQTVTGMTAGAVKC